jgi:hypothetical protein
MIYMRNGHIMMWIFMFSLGGRGCFLFFPLKISSKSINDIPVVMILWIENLPTFQKLLDIQLYL